MTVQTEVNASGTSASADVPLTRREALARERAAQSRRAPAPAPEVAPPVELAPAPTRSVASPAGDAALTTPRRETRTRLWSPRRTHLPAQTPTISSSAPRSPQHWTRGLVGVAVVAGLFATFGIPAYSLSTDGAAFATSNLFTSAQQAAQSVDVSGAASGQAAGADGYISETAAQVAAQRIQAIRSAPGYVPSFQSSGDDYPYWNLPTEYNGGGLSPLGYFYRECVDFVAWRLNRDAGSTSAPWRFTWHNLASGSAYMWYSAWQSKGWPTSSVPVPGAVAWFPYNHVAYVKSVNSDGTVNIEEYNQQSDHLYHSRTIAPSDAVYLYPPG